LITGQVECWGFGKRGALGDGAKVNSDVPVTVSGLDDVSSLVSQYGGAGFCALLDTDRVACWGANSDGELGDGTKTSSDVPVAVSDLSDVASLSGGGFSGGDGYCAVLTSGQISCWGDNNWGELGNGTDEQNSDVPTSVSGITDAVNVLTSAVNSGVSATRCALLTTGGVDCWGNGPAGELGNGTISGPTYVPVPVTGVTTATSVAADSNQGGFCALLVAGGAQCWGSNTYSQLGDGTNYGSSDVPVTVSGLADATYLTGVPIDAYCALLSDGTIDTWGSNDYGFGAGANNTSNVAVPVFGIGPNAP
jgi:alpha-tubulin suppressor-like RCC1 family protein